jgi:starvation-inducible DNA-binding protein
MSDKQAAGLNAVRKVLSDTFVLYMKTYAVHWNFTGADFFSVHKLTEMQYGELAEAVDEIAERVRALGHEAPVALGEVLDSADLKEFKAGKLSSGAMLEELVRGHELLAKRAKEAVDATADANDDFSNDMMIGRVGAHQKAAWMLKSFMRR